jgi:hypothetical protein
MPVMASNGRLISKRNASARYDMSQVPETTATIRSLREPIKGKSAR